MLRIILVAEHCKYYLIYIPATAMLLSARQVRESTYCFMKYLVYIARKTSLD